jgi:thiosulfate reductase cytochrome b subunit
MKRVFLLLFLLLGFTLAAHADDLYEITDDSVIYIENAIHENLDGEHGESGEEKEIWSPAFIIEVIIFAVILTAVLLHMFLRVILSPKTVGKEEKIYLYPIPIRIWHWLNAITFVMLLISGMLGHFEIIPHETVKTIHQPFASTLLFLWIYFLIANVLTKNKANYKINKGFANRSLVQAKYYMFGIFKGEPHPFHAEKGNKFNPLQQITYVAVIYVMIPALIVTGILAIVFHGVAAQVHMAFSMLALIFLTGHIYLSLCGSYPFQYIKGMLDGYHRSTKSIYKPNSK